MMIMTPFVSGFTAPLYALRKRWFKHELLQTINLPETGLQDHVVIAGGGRIGQYVAQLLQQLELNFVIIELDYHRIGQAREAGFPVIYGDAGQKIVLEVAQVERARLVVVTTPVITITQSIVERVRHLNSDVHIVARAEGIEQMQALYAQGVYEVVQPEFEAGLEITRQTLLHFDVSISEIQRLADATRQELYAPLQTRK